jgi:isopentenyl phosphate kinase
MAKKNQHVVPLWGWWAIKKEWSKKFTTITETKAQAEKIAKEIAKNNKSELIIHGKDWKIQSRNSYWNDPHPPKG